MVENGWDEVRTAKLKLLHTERGDKFVIECNGEERLKVTLDRWEFIRIFGSLYDAVVNGDDHTVRIEVGAVN